MILKISDFLRSVAKSIRQPNRSEKSKIIPGGIPQAMASIQRDVLISP